MSNLSIVFQQIIKIFRITLKEWKLLLRNHHALIILFIMPSSFVLIMSITLKNSLISQINIPIIGWVIEDTGVTASQWAGDWQNRYKGYQFKSRNDLLLALKSRKIEAGVIVHNHWLDQNGRPLNEKLEIWLSNRVQPAVAARLRAELIFSSLQVQMKIAAAESGPFASILLKSSISDELLPHLNTPKIKYIYEIESGKVMTAVQQSVPAWLVFGMFFVVIPIAGVLIQERNEGTLIRLGTFGVSSNAVILGKTVAFIFLNWLQLIVMIIVGHWIVPIIGGDALQLNVSLLWFFLMTISTSAAAVGLAMLIASYARNFEHAAALGGGLNVILAAIAGIMVPRMLMPVELQNISEWSPMGLALDGMQSVFLGDPDFWFIIPRAGLLLIFSIFCLFLSWFSLSRKTLSNLN